MKWIDAATVKPYNKFSTGKRLQMGSLIIGSTTDGISANTTVAICMLPGIEQRKHFTSPNRPNREAEARDWVENQVQRWFQLVKDGTYGLHSPTS